MDTEMNKLFGLKISNPSNHSRPGHIVIPLSKLPKFKSETTVLEDQQGRFWPYQISEHELSEKEMVFSLPKSTSISPGESIMLTAWEKQDKKQEDNGTVDLEIELSIGANHGTRGFRLWNSRLSLWFSLVPHPYIAFDNNKNYYAGSAVTVQLDNNEFLDGRDSFDVMHHDLEKRCMQLDKIYLYDRVQKVGKTVELFNQHHEYVAYEIGPVRASFIIKVQISDQLGDIKVECNLYRVISLYANTDYVIEDIYLKGSQDKDIENLEFSAHYFSHINLGFDTVISCGNVSNWLACHSPYVCSIFGPCQNYYLGYGFASNQSVTHSSNGAPDPCDLSWELSPATSLRCLHLFMRRLDQNFDDTVGRYWHNVIDKPLEFTVIK